MNLLGPEGRQQLRQGSKVAALGLELGLSVAVGAFTGTWLDARFGTGPWLTYVLLLCGLAAGSRSVYRLVKRTNMESL
ncbi:MAG: AtpZ/AtpI family protein [Sandaracinaceae bacterium]|nr:AtpZ/AtpI family protein [Sandaracinaceae bacterium]